MSKHPNPRAVITAYLDQRHAILHGTDLERLEALEKLTPETSTEFGFLALTIAHEGARALLEQRAKLPARFHAAPFMPDPDGDKTPVALAAAQIITAIANDDREMAIALVKPWTNGTHSSQDCAEMLMCVVANTVHQHSMVCGAGA